MDGSPADGFRAKPGWLLAVLVLTVGQAGLSLPVFGGWSGLHDSRPIVAGRHPLHLYHGSLGSETFRQRYATACFDPNFQAGYPKTPVFDGGCRPAELFLTISGRGYDPAAYKIGLFICCLLVPGAFVLASRGIGLSAPGACLAGAFGCGVWWSAPVRAMFDAGDSDLLLAGMSAIIFISWLSRYNWEPGITAWLILSGTAIIGWYAHPVVWLGLAPVLGIYYLAVAPRHGPGWHLGLFGISSVGIALNMWWIWDWAKFWWLRQPSVDDVAPLPTWGALLDSWDGNGQLFGPAPLGWPMVVAGMFGCVWFARANRKTAPALLVLTGLLAFCIARLGQTWPPLANGGAERAAPLVAALAVLPAAWMAQTIGKTLPYRSLLLLIIVLLPAIAGWGGYATGPLRYSLGLRTERIAMGLNAEQEKLVKEIATRTTREGRILIEDGPSIGTSWNWTALLPMYTERAFLGGLDPDARFEHAFCGLRSDRMNGKLLAEWTDIEMLECCRRYNIGWVVCRTNTTADRWRKVASVREISQFGDGMILFQIVRDCSFVLVGSAKWEQADRKKVVLTDIVPADSPHPDGGPIPAKVIVISLHYQAGLRVSPNVVTVERDPDPHDPIPMIRLRMNGPMSRLVISWENP